MHRPNLSEPGCRARAGQGVAWRCNLRGDADVTASLDQPCARRLVGVAGRDEGKAPVEPGKADGGKTRC
jgi:hypothetical protein